MIRQGSELDTIRVSEIVPKLRGIAIHSLTRMYRPEEQLFAFSLRKNGNSEVLDGVSRRYTATVLVGLADEDTDVVKEVLGNHSREDVCRRLLQDMNEMKDLGEVALTTWAARALRYSKASTVVEALRWMEPGLRPYSTMELSWPSTAAKPPIGHLQIV